APQGPPLLGIVVAGHGARLEQPGGARHRPEGCLSNRMVESGAILRFSALTTFRGDDSSTHLIEAGPGGNMKVIDSLLIAPLMFCLIGALIGVLTDVRISALFQAVTAASMVALAAHWLIGRIGRRRRPASA